MDGIGCLEIKEVPICTKVKYVEEFNDATYYLVKNATYEASSRNPFMKCVN
jgi:hypothetical protein